MEDINLTPEQSVQVIRRMLEDTRKSTMKGAGVPYLIWGYTTFVTSLVVYFLLPVIGAMAHLFWFLIPLVGFTFSAIYYGRRSKAPKTELTRAMGIYWTVLGIIALVLGIMRPYVSMPILTIILLLIGGGTVTSGYITRLRPLQVSGILGMVMGVVVAFLPASVQPLAFGIAFLLMQCLPGHILCHTLREQSHE